MVNTHTLDIGNRNKLAVKVDPNTKEYTFILHDEHFENIVVLATLSIGGKWTYTTPVGINRLMNIAKQNRKVRKLIHQITTLSDEQHKSSFAITWDCFKRRFHIRIHKIKNVIHL
jgi:hypothetical protein